MPRAKRMKAIITGMWSLHCPACRKKHFYFIKKCDVYRCRKCGSLFKVRDYGRELLMVYTLTKTEAAKVEKSLNSK
jgi:ribosomal protein L37AE/L43A